MGTKCGCYTLNTLINVFTERNGNVHCTSLPMLVGYVNFLCKDYYLHRLVYINGEIMENQSAKFCP